MTNNLMSGTPSLIGTVFPDVAVPLVELAIFLETMHPTLMFMTVVPLTTNVTGLDTTHPIDTMIRRSIIMMMTMIEAGIVILPMISISIQEINIDRMVLVSFFN